MKSSYMSICQFQMSHLWTDTPTLKAYLLTWKVSQLNRDVLALRGAGRFQYRSRILTRLRAGRSGFGSRQGQELLFVFACRPALGLTRPPVLCIPRDLSLRSYVAGPWSRPLASV